MGDPPWGRRVQGGRAGGRSAATVRDGAGFGAVEGTSGSGDDVAGADGNGVA